MASTFTAEPLSRGMMKIRKDGAWIGCICRIVDHGIWRTSEPRGGNRVTRIEGATAEEAARNHWGAGAAQVAAAAAAAMREMAPLIQVVAA